VITAPTRYFSTKAQEGTPITPETQVLGVSGGPSEHLKEINTSVLGVLGVPARHVLNSASHRVIAYLVRDLVRNQSEPLMPVAMPARQSVSHTERKHS
jgi:hypothetical protein